MTTTVAPADTALDVAAVRRDFPLLAREAHGHPLVYLDSANTTQKPEAVIRASDRFYREQNANIHRSTYRLSEEATAAYEGARETVRRVPERRARRARSSSPAARPSRSTSSRRASARRS